MKKKFIDAYMDVAKRFAMLSSAKRLQVGSIIVKDDRIISIGYNGMPAGWTNDCETKLYHNPEWEDLHYDEIESQYPFNDTYGNYRLTTKPEVIHAEANAIAKLARGPESGLGAEMFLTHSPCIDCAKQIYTSGIKKVYFNKHYRSNDGLDFLNKCGVDTELVE